MSKQQQSTNLSDNKILGQTNKQQKLEISILNQISSSVQVSQVLKSLQKISQINIQSPQFKSSLQSFSQQHLTLYKSHTNNNGQIQYYTFLSQQRHNDHYINQLTSQLFRVQYLEGLVLQRKQNDIAKLNQNHHKLINLLYQKLSNYLNLHYSKPYAATCYFKLSQSNTIQHIIIGLTNKYTNQRNYSTGQWTSYWNFKPNQYQYKITSRNHFSQSGNILFQRPKHITKTLSNQQQLQLTNLNEQTIDRIIKIISKQQKLYQKQLQNIYTQKISQSLKKIRRISPLTQGKMIWNINAVLLSQGLNQKMTNFH